MQSMRNNWKWLTQLLLVALLVAVSVGAGDSSGRYDKLSHQIMCPCSCNELLGECNHVGCPDSDGMRTRLLSAIDRGDSTKTILLAFQDEYGPTALAAPRFTAFNHLAWIMPPLLAAIGILLVALIVRHWKQQPVVAAVKRTGYTKAELEAVRERIRRDIDD